MEKVYLFNREYLIGYQFSGLNDKGCNFVSLTAWLNSGNDKGIDASGDLLPIQLGSDKETVDPYGITAVILDNYSKNVDIDYLTGAVGFLSTVQQSVALSESVVANASKELQLTEVVHITHHGKRGVY